MKKIMEFLMRQKHVWPLLYVFLYVPWFYYLEHTYNNLSKVTLIHCALDDVIPFCEIFVVPYLLWFLYIPFVFIVIFFTSKNEFYRLCAYEFIGMTIALLVCTIFPNGHDLRVDPTIRDNIFMDLLSSIYTNDTSTNVLPSIHVFATITAHICLTKSISMQRHKYICRASLIFTVLVFLSTVFLKQHSIIDSICGALLSCILYIVIFEYLFKTVPSLHKSKKQRPALNTNQ